MAQISCHASLKESNSPTGSPTPIPPKQAPLDQAASPKFKHSSQSDVSLLLARRVPLLGSTTALGGWSRDWVLMCWSHPRCAVQFPSSVICSGKTVSGVGRDTYTMRLNDGVKSEVFPQRYKIYTSGMLTAALKNVKSIAVRRASGLASLPCDDGRRSGKLDLLTIRPFCSSLLAPWASAMCQTRTRDRNRTGCDRA